MTRQEQLSCLTDRPCAVCKHHTDNGCSQWKCVFDEQPCEDAISRQQCIDAVNKILAQYVPKIYLYTLPLELEKVITDLPSVSTKKTGRWEMCEDADGLYGICSVCGVDADFRHYGIAYKWCPNCGAKMEVEE